MNLKKISGNIRNKWKVFICNCILEGGSSTHLVLAIADDDDDDDDDDGLLHMYIFLVSFRGQKKLGPRPDRSPLGIWFKISHEHPHPFHMGSPPPPLPIS